MGPSSRFDIGPGPNNVFEPLTLVQDDGTQSKNMMGLDPKYQMEPGLKHDTYPVLG